MATLDLKQRVYWQIDVANFVKQLDEEGGVLLSVERLMLPDSVLCSGYMIKYKHTKELTISVFT